VSEDGTENGSEESLSAEAVAAHKEDRLLRARTARQAKVLTATAGPYPSTKGVVAATRAAAEEATWATEAKAHAEAKVRYPNPNPNPNPNLNP